MGSNREKKRKATEEFELIHQIKKYLSYKVSEHQFWLQIFLRLY